MMATHCSVSSVPEHCSVSSVPKHCFVSGVPKKFQSMTEEHTLPNGVVLVFKNGILFRIKVPSDCVKLILHGVRMVCHGAFENDVSTDSPYTLVFVNIRRLSENSLVNSPRIERIVFENATPVVFPPLFGRGLPNIRELIIPRGTTLTPGSLSNCPKLERVTIVDPQKVLPGHLKVLCKNAESRFLKIIFNNYLQERLLSFLAYSKSCTSITRVYRLISTGVLVLKDEAESYGFPRCFDGSLPK